MNYLTTLLQLRLLVGFLGERAQLSWWPTAFYDPASRPFLEPVFARTTRLAQYHGVVEAARRVHDEHLNVDSYHLFRLPEEVEQDLHALMFSTISDGSAERVPEGKDAALGALAQVAAGSRKDAAGPIAMGSIEALSSTDLLKSIAAAYASAFAQGGRAYPYLVA